MAKQKRQFTAVYRKAGRWYLGWIEEVPGANTQGRTLREAKENLKDALLLVLETNRLLNVSGGGRGKVIRESLAISA